MTRRNTKDVSLLFNVQTGARVPWPTSCERYRRRCAVQFQEDYKSCDCTIRED